ncbi:hypothetical protein ACLOJK_000500 [Asimina triloba]
MASCLWICYAVRSLVVGGHGCSLGKMVEHRISVLRRPIRTWKYVEKLVVYLHFEMLPLLYAEAHLPEIADWKQKHKTLKEEVRGLKESGLRRDMEASIMKKNQSHHLPNFYYNLDIGFCLPMPATGKVLPTDLS